MNLTDDPVSMPLNRARRLINFLISRSGQVRANVRLVNQLPAGLPFPIDGVTWYYNAAFSNTPFVTELFFSDLLIWSTQGFLFRGTPAPDPLVAGQVTFPAVVPNGITGYALRPFFEGKRVRFFALGDEVIAVQEGGLLPVRFYFSPTLGSGFFRAGIEPPTVFDSGTGQGNLQLRTSGTGLTGTWGYKMTFADERFRESSPNPVVNITLTNQGTRATINNIGFFAPPASFGGSNLIYAYLYRNTIAAPDVFYRIAFRTLSTLSDHSTTPLSPQDFGAGDFFFNANAFDNAADADITGGVLAPSPGENDPPLPASIGVIHQNRVFLNDINDANTLQVSNLGSTTQFAALTVQVTDGGRFTIGTDQGNTITALVEFGSVLAIFKRRGSYFLYGDNITDFVVRPVHERGCVAPDSCARCDNVICFLSDDGVYAASYEAGDVVTKISKEIEADLLTLPQSTFEAAIGYHIDNRYHLAIGDTTYVYDFDAQGWTCYCFGSGLLSLQNGIPDAFVQAKVGYGALGNSALYGAIVPCGGGDDAPPACDVAVVPPTLDFPGGGGSLALLVTPANSSATPYQSFAPWLAINGPQFGQGSATVTAQANPLCMQRIGFVQVCYQQVQVTQERSPDCNCMMVSLTPSTFSVDFTAQSVITGYIETDASTITVFSLAPWLHPHAPVPGVPFTGTITIDIDANGTCQDRTGQVQVCNLFVTVNQAADPGCGCNVLISPNLLEVHPNQSGSGGFTVTNLTAGAYSCVVDVPWITVNECPGNLGAGTFVCEYTYSFAPQDTPGHITLCNAVFTIIANQHS